MDGVVSLGTGVDLSRTFQLHSNPYATKTIFLDFDGFDISSTPWENGRALSLGAFFSSFDTTALNQDPAHLAARRRRLLPLRHQRHHRGSRQ